MGGSNSKNDFNLNAKQKVEPEVKKFITIGLGNTGKSSLIYRLKHGVPPKDYWSGTVIGVDLHDLHQDGLKLQAGDYNGRGRPRVMFRMFSQGNSGIIYMIDSDSANDDVSKFDESMDCLSHLLEYEELTNMTVMVVANKQDLDNAVGPEVIEEWIKNNCNIKPGFSVFVMPMSVTAEDDHSVKLAFRLFLKTMKRKDAGKVKSGLIPRAWETAEKDVEDSENESEDEDDTDRQDDHETKVTDKDGEKDGEKKSSLINPIHVFKSILIH